MHSIESKIHHIVLNLDPSLAHEYVDQAIIVAEAAANYRVALKNIENKRYASTKERADAEESLIIDGILDAMNVIACDDSNDMRYSFSSVNDMFDGDDDVAYEEILRNFRYSSDILNEDEMSDDLLEEKKDDTNLFEIEDQFSDEHPSDLYHLQGIIKHRSDSNVR